MKYTFFSIILSTFLTFNVHAQKFGYVDTQDLISNMTEMKLADKELQKLQNELVAKGEEMVIKFEAEYKKYMAEANSGTLSRVQIQQKEAVLVEQQEEIKNFETDIQMQLTKKKEELYTPLLNKVREEINKLGTEGGYTMIFDQSLGMILHAAESENLTPLLKTKLGIH